MGILDGKVAVITGGTRGLGFAIAQAFCRAGASVVVASRSQKSVDAAVAGLRAEGLHASGLALDVANLAEVEALAEKAKTDYGRLDIWVNNAGLSAPYGPTCMVDPKIFQTLINTNILGVYNGSRTAMAHFLKQGKGKLINMLGRGDDHPVPFQNAYSSSKNWVRAFTKALAEENKGSGVEVLAFNPGMVLTDMLTDVQVIKGSESGMKPFPKIVRMWAKPAEYPAQKAVWIASEATDGKTGLKISMLTPGLILSGALKEGLRSLFHSSQTDQEIKINTVQPYHGG